MAADLRKLAVAGLRPYKRNPRKGDVAAIAASLEANGQYRPLVVNEGTLTGRPLEVLAGNHTLEAAKRLSWETIHAAVIDVDEETAARIVAADNRTADLGGYDLAALVDLLDSLDDLTGTGYSDDDLDELKDDLLLPEPIALPTDYGKAGEGAVKDTVKFTFRSSSIQVPAGQADRLMSVYDAHVLAHEGDDSGFIRAACERVTAVLGIDEEAAG